MSQVYREGQAWQFAALALLGLLAFVALSGHAHAVGEAVQPSVSDVLEGQSFDIQVTWGVGDSTESVQVSCAHCGNGWTASSTRTDGTTPAGQRYSILTFPDDFHGALGQPRFAENYTLSMPGAALATGNVTVHLVDDFAQAGPYPVTSPVHIQTSGWTGSSGGQLLNVTISKWMHTGALSQVASLRLQPAGLAGIASYEWRVPKELAADMDCPGIGGKCRNFTLRIEGPGKVETAGFSAVPATLNASLLYLSNGPGDAAVPLINQTLDYNRTGNVSLSLDVRYLNGAPLLPKDMTQAGNASLNGTLRLAVERITTAQGNSPVATRLDWVYATWSPRGWRATWAIPSNVTTTETGADNPLYRLRLVAQDDAYHNSLPDVNGTGFRILPLRIQPVQIRGPGATEERLTNITAQWHLEYLDHRAWNGTSNSSTMRATLVDASSSTVQSVQLTYDGKDSHGQESGNWTATFRPDMAYKPLGTYKLRLLGASDNDGNEVVPAATLPFDLVAAKPRVELRTRVSFLERNETEGFQRGDLVEVDANVAYADGTPFTRERLPPGSTAALLVNVTKVDAKGVEHGRFSVGLAPGDQPGDWTGGFPLKELDDTNPLGPWRFTLDVQDRESPPNENITSFTRWVHGAPIHASVTKEPEALVRAGETVTLRFTAAYADGSALDERTAAGGFFVYGKPYSDGTKGNATVRLFPLYDHETGQWTATWPTNSTTYVGEYVLDIEGKDAFGNVVQAQDTRHVQVFVDRIQRQVLREPPSEVHRGEVILAVFDGAQGDLGSQGSDAPRIEVQKWNPVRHAFEREIPDVSVNSSDGSPDHWARFLTGPATNLGKYRLALFARNDQHAEVVAYSREFSVLPVELERAWLPTALNVSAGNLSKGQQVLLQLRREEGDLVEQAVILHDGELVTNVSTLLKTGRFDVPWRTPFTLADGTYSVVVRGRDIHNNTFASPPLPLNLTGVRLDAKVPAPPLAALQRAQRIDLRALVQYPDQTNVHTGTFFARFVQDNVTLADVPLANNRSGWLLSWVPPSTTPLGKVSVVLHGDDDLGNQVQDKEVFSFQLAEGVLHRDFSFQRNVANRTDLVLWTLPADANDTQMDFVLRDDSGATFPLQSTLDPAKGEYAVKWRPAKDEKLARYTLQATGADKAHNAVLGESRGLTLRPAQVGVKFTSTPPRDVESGKTYSWVFELRYADGTVLPATSENRPQVALLQGADTPIDPPTLSVQDGKWVASWTPIAGKHSGVYKLAIGGRDQYLNEVQLSFGNNVLIKESVVKQFLGVPGFEVLLLPVALLGAALLLRRRDVPR